MTKSGNRSKRQSTSRRLLSAAILATPALAVVAATGAASAASLYWDIDAAATVGAGGTAPGGTWNLSGPNWNTQADGGLVPGAWTAGETAVFAAGTNATDAYQIEVEGIQSAGGIVFEEGAVTLNGGELALTGPVEVIATGATINSVISGGGLTKTGAGTLTLAATTTNTFTGPINVNAGTLSVATDAALGTASNAITLDNGTLQITASIGTSATATNTRNITLVNNGTIRTSAGQATFHSGVISGAGSLTKTGTTTFVLGTANTYTGNTIITEGTLVSNGINSLGANGNSVVLNGGTLRLSADYAETRGLALAADSRLDTGITATYAGVISGGGVLTKIGVGTMVLTGANTYTGATKVDAGVLQFNSAGAIGGSGQSVELTAQGAVVTNYAPLDQAFIDSRINTASTGSVALTADSSTNFDLSNHPTLHIGAVGNVTYSGTPTLGAGPWRYGGGGGTLTVTTPLSGNVGFSKTGAGTVVLPAVNTFTGPITLNGGTLAVASDATLGNASNNINLAGGTTLRADGDVNTSRVLSGAGAFTKTGTGKLTLNGDNSAYTGNITLSTGITEITNSNALGNGGATGGTTTIGNGAQLHSSGDLTVTDRFTLAGGTASIISNSGTLTLSGGPIFHGANTTLVLGGAGNITTTSSPNTNIASGSGTNTVIKNGSGTLTLNGNSSWTGGIVINEGVVAFPNDGSSSRPLGAAPGALDPDNIIINGGTLRTTSTAAGTFYTVLLANRGMQLGPNGGTFDVQGTNPIAIYTGTIGLTPGTTGATFTKTGPHEFRYNSGNRAATGFTKLVVNQGLFRLGSVSGQDTELGFGAAPTAGFLQDAITLNGGSIATSYAAGDSVLHANRGITLGAGHGTIASNLTVPAKITGVGNLTGSSGTIVLGGPNDFTGNLVVNTTFTLNENMNLGGVAGTAGTAQSASIASGKTIVAGSNNQNTNFKARFTGAGAFEKVGTGTLTLEGNDFTNTGGVTITGGTVKFGVSSAGLSNAGLITIGANGILDMNAINDTMGALGGAGPIINGGNLTVGGTATTPTNVSGTWSGNYAGAGTFTKNGGGTQNLEGSNSFGVVTINGGTLGASSSNALGSSGTNGLTIGEGTLRATGAIASPGRAVTVTGAAATIDTNGNPVTLGAAAGAGSLTKSGAGTLTVSHVRTSALTVGEGIVRVADSGGAAGGTSKIGAIAVTGTAQFDLRDNKLITPSALGTAAPGPNDTRVYSGISGQIQSGFVNGQGDWSGPGIVTSTEAALGGLVTLGSAVAGEVLPFESETILWGGQTVGMADTIVMYTHTGDANLDGSVDGGDYAFIDAYVGSAAADAAYYKGDFNYDGFIDGGDYAYIDVTVGATPMPASGGSGVAGAGLTAVPEPASLSVIALGAAALLGRRRRK